MSNQLHDAVKFITMGLAIGFTLIAYANTNFATRTETADIKHTQEYIIDLMLKRLDRIENKIDNLDKR